MSCEVPGPLLRVQVTSPIDSPVACDRATPCFVCSILCFKNVDQVSRNTSLRRLSRLLGLPENLKLWGCLSAVKHDSVLHEAAISVEASETHIFRNHHFKGNRNANCHYSRHTTRRRKEKRNSTSETSGAYVAL
eukprot:Gregarina_sp_Poly_1__5632@NODE_2970_length_1492_cov_8_927719_g1875_i0_p1_GENE_NODE_2970_length_1492_cov_8_927719_g1875_i0NODE_2970_length_1492_cov_8_927719_g1875_i0_p1_ORF_typecomplete_len134_score4_18_NODE_2970_length_1492_cov_8_927719_g1875_i010381439